ncbi:unnamed protein product [Gadus morhua 'NCC']
MGVLPEGLDPRPETADRRRYRVCLYRRDAIKHWGVVTLEKPLCWLLCLRALGRPGEAPAAWIFSPVDERLESGAKCRKNRPVAHVLNSSGNQIGRAGRKEDSPGTVDGFGGGEKDESADDSWTRNG